LQNIYIYLDDSGVLHKNSKEKYFIYAGYLFLSKDEKDNAKRKYLFANREIKKTNGYAEHTELKAFLLSNKHKRSLYNVLRCEQSLSASVYIPNLYSSILGDKKSICRYKDYALKRTVKNKIQYLIQQGAINPTLETSIYLNIDEQLTATNGYYSLGSSIKEELRHGIFNNDYGTLHEALFSNELTVNVRYCNSSSHYLIQASDILANKIFGIYNHDRNTEMQKISNHKHLTLP